MIVILLGISCALAIFLLITTEPVPQRNLHSTAQLDSLITLAFHDTNIRDNQVRMNTVRTDSVFYRNVYTVRVPGNFSKTTLHYKLHDYALPYDIDTVARVEFPEEDMRIHLIVNNKVYRSVFLISE